MNNGAFRSKTPSTAFFVDVSEQLNTPTVIFAGKLIAPRGPRHQQARGVHHPPHQPGHARARGRARGRRGMRS